jgi:hypothetical protein
MSLPDWERNGWLQSHKSSPNEVRDLLAVVDRDLADSAADGLSADWRLNIAYNAGRWRRSRGSPPPAPGTSSQSPARGSAPGTAPLDRVRRDRVVHDVGHFPEQLLEHESSLPWRNAVQGCPAYVVSGRLLARDLPWVPALHHVTGAAR